MNDNYIRASEFLLLVGLWFGPPIVVSLWVQGIFFRRTIPKLVRKHRLIAAVTSAGASTFLGLVVFVASPFRNRFLWQTELGIGEHTFPFLPLAYLSTALMAALVAARVRGR